MQKKSNNLETRTSSGNNCRTTVPVYCEIHKGAESIDVPALRKKFNMTQLQFADMLGISAKTLESWEQGIRKPSSPARSLLTRAQADLQKKAA